TLGTNGGSSQNYKDSDDRVIFDGADDTDYDWNIAGIGRDDKSGLNQKQSKTIYTDDDITVGIKELATSNKTNSTNFLANKTFLIWGNDNDDDGVIEAGTDITNDFGAGNVTAERIDRIWKMVVTDSVPTVKLSLPKSMVSIVNPGDADDYIMIVADDELFTENVTSATMKIATDSLNVNYYFEGTKYITFGSAPEVAMGDNAVYFNNTGTTDTYLDAGDVNDLNDTSFSISAWVRRDTGEDKFDVVSKRNYFDETLGPPENFGGFSYGYAFRINQTSNLRLVWKNHGDNTTNQLQTTEEIPDNEWHHVAATYDDTNNYAALYIDGVFVYDSDDFEAANGYPIEPMEEETDAHFMIGAAHHIKRQQKVRGSIDEVRVWDVALDSTQIRYIMNQEIEEDINNFVAGKILPAATTKNDIVTIPWDNLIAYYPMSTQIFGSIKDESNSGNDASMINVENSGSTSNFDGVEAQTAPLPYKTTGNGDWDTSTTWENGSVQYLPGVVSYLYENEAIDTDKITMDYNIVQIDHDVDLNNSDSNLIPLYKNKSRTVLGLIVGGSGDLELEGTTGTIDANALSISHYLELDGIIDLEGESQLIQTDQSDLAVSSSGYLERDQQGTQNSYTYNYWSSPVSLINNTANNVAFKISDVMKDGTTTSTPKSINFDYPYAHADGALDDPIKTSTYWIWKFVNLSNEYANWQWVGDFNTINVTEGYTMKGTSGASAITDDQNYTFRGKPNNGDFTHTTFPGSFDTNGNPFVTLTGNPYPSALDADAFIDDNINSIGGGSDGITGTLYFWEHWSDNTHYLSDYQGGYATYTKAGGTLSTSHPDIDPGGAGNKTAPGQYIPVGQGFFVIQHHDDDGFGNLTNPSSGSVEFKNSQRVFEIEYLNLESIFTRNANVNKDPDPNEAPELEDEELLKQRIWLDVENAEGFHRQILASFLSGATDKIDRGYDGRIIDPLDSDVYFIQENKNFGIIAFGEFDKEREIPMIITVGENDSNKTQKIKLDKTENISESIGVYIKDNTTEETIDIRNETFEVALDIGEYKDRFSLVFKSKSSTENEEEEEEEIDQEPELYEGELVVFMNNNTNSVDIRKTLKTNLTSVTMINTLGQVIQVWSSNLKGEQLSLPVNNISSGAYILNLNVEEKIISKKIIIQ
ncbi:MAG: T9SS type A sorting domain-containing protein, partial [Urechidicola sp.]|nr:T9SS type A sorting domain-containing protein [Urechidicola sp.]